MYYCWCGETVEAKQPGINFQFGFRFQSTFCGEKLGFHSKNTEAEDVGSNISQFVARR